jgi:hypothetical protein
VTQEQHFDVAAYALGVLDERDAARFEEHLVVCPSCPIELESMLPVVDVLADVDPDSLVAAEQSRRDGLVLKRLIGDVKHERRRANSRRLYSLAAAVVVFAMLSIGALFAGGRWFDADPVAPDRIAQRTSDPSLLDPLPPPGGFGGPELVGERIGGSDPRTGVRLDAGLEAKDWGTQVSFAVANIKGPLTCRLVAIRRDGQAEVLSTWTVGPKGWGTTAQSRALMLQAVTALPRADIAHLQVQAVAPNGTAENLVRVP